MHKKRILVTGAAGFIGFHTARKLNKRGDFVLGIDNFNSYYTPTLKRKREEILKNEGVEILEADISEKTLFKQLFEKYQFTHVLHLAAQAGVRYAKENPDAYLKSNLEGFLNLLECLRLFPHVQVVYASSSSVYGCNEKIPFSIHDTTEKPANFYAATKKTNELMAYAYNYLYGLKLTGLRYFTVYGPWGRPDMAYFSFSQAIMQGKPIRLFNEGKMHRDFTYIDDVVAGTIAALDSKEAKAVYNIGNNHPEPLLKLVSLLEQKLGKKAEIILEGPSRGEVETTFADIEESKKDLKFNPSTSLEQGLSSFVEWFCAMRQEGVL